MYVCEAFRRSSCSSHTILGGINSDINTQAAFTSEKLIQILVGYGLNRSILIMHIILKYTTNVMKKG